LKRQRFFQLQGRGYTRAATAGADQPTFTAKPSNCV